MLRKSDAGLVGKWSRLRRPAYSIRLKEVTGGVWGGGGVKVNSGYFTDYIMLLSLVYWRVLTASSESQIGLHVDGSAQTSPATRRQPPRWGCSVFPALPSLRHLKHVALRRAYTTYTLAETLCSLIFFFFLVDQLEPFFYMHTARTHQLAPCCLSLFELSHCNTNWSQH